MIEIPVDQMLDSETIRTLVSAAVYGGTAVLIFVCLFAVSIVDSLIYFSNRKERKQIEKYIKAMEQKLELMLDEK